MVQPSEEVLSGDIDVVRDLWRQRLTQWDDGLREGEKHSGRGERQRDLPPGWFDHVQSVGCLRRVSTSPEADAGEGDDQERQLLREQVADRKWRLASIGGEDIDKCEEGEL